MTHTRRIEPADLIGNILRSGPRMALFLGAGASVSSGIPTAKELVQQWQKELYRRATSNGYGEPFEAWLSEHNEEFQRSFEDRGFKGDPESKRYSYTFEEVAPTRAERQHIIADLCDQAVPRAGYYALATLMENGVFDTILTTNFDDLVAEACFDVGATRPQVSAHTETVRLVRLTSERPKIVKLHGDYLFEDLQNTEVETQALRRGMEDVLKSINHEFGLVIIGYGGNDDSIMNVLEDLGGGNPQGLFWCVRAGSATNSRVQDLLDSSNDTFLVEIDDFDQLMVRILRQIGARIDPLFQRRAERTIHMRKTLAVLSGTSDVKDAVAEADEGLKTIQHLNEGVEAYNRLDLLAAEANIRKVLDQEPGQPHALMVLSAIQLDQGNTADAIESARQAVAALRDPSSMSFLAVALFAAGELVESEKTARKSLKIKRSASALNSLGIALRDQERLDEALEALTEAQTLNEDEPTSAIGLANLASVRYAKGDLDGASSEWQHALGLLSTVGPTQRDLVAGIVNAVVGRVAESIDAFERWHGRTRAPVRADVIRYLKFLEEHGHGAAAGTLQRLREAGLVGGA